MQPLKADQIAQLRKELLSLTGFKATWKHAGLDAFLGPIKTAFPNHTFPLGAVHEMIAKTPGDLAASRGFIAGLLSALIDERSVIIWICSTKNIFPPAFQLFGVEPDRIIFLNLHKEKEILWAMEEALKCTGLAAVIAETKDLSFTASRRLQLVVEESQVTGFIVLQDPRSIQTTACLTRWQISPMASDTEDHLPGVGFPKWNVELLKVRNGQPGKWQLSFAEGRFRFLSKTRTIPFSQQKKTG